LTWFVLRFGFQLPRLKTGNAQSNSRVAADRNAAALAALVHRHHEGLGPRADANEQAIAIGVVALSRLEGQGAQSGVC